MSSLPVTESLLGTKAVQTKCASSLPPPLSGLWISQLYFNTSLTEDEDGERLRVKDVLSQFFGSSEWLSARAVWDCSLSVVA